MARKPGRRATYDDLVNLPEHVVGEILDGELFVSPRPALPHAAATSGGRATVRRARRARQRLRVGTTGESRKIDTTQTPERRIHVSETPDRVIK